MEFFTIASGSKGNCAYVSSAHTKLLIDVGVSGKVVTNCLEKFGIDGNELSGIFVTHEHTDHIKGVGIISRKYNVPIYATEGTWAGMNHALGKIAPSNRHVIYPGEPCILNDLRICPFEIPHDAAEPVGYSIFCGDKKVCVATDLGCTTKEIESQLRDCDIILLESNHDEGMVENGGYPMMLKRRILGNTGHLSNRTAGDLIARIMSNKLKYVYLGHLSDENNYPKLALKTVSEVLSEHGIFVGSSLQLKLAEQHRCSEKIVF
ncbi:MAG: MBL fold metallo-hydrolase [Bacillota bacterium]